MQDMRKDDTDKEDMKLIVTNPETGEANYAYLMEEREAGMLEDPTVLGRAGDKVLILGGPADMSRENMEAIAGGGILLQNLMDPADALVEDTRGEDLGSALAELKQYENVYGGRESRPMAGMLGMMDGVTGGAMGNYLARHTKQPVERNCAYCEGIFDSYNELCCSSECATAYKERERIANKAEARRVSAAAKNRRKSRKKRKKC